MYSNINQIFFKELTPNINLDILILGENMKLVYENKEINLIECISFYNRLKGFMFKKNIKHALLFEHCNSIHTFFMKENIDVVLCNKNNTILHYYKNLSPNHIILPKKNVTKVFELPTNYFDIKINNRLEIKK